MRDGTAGSHVTSAQPLAVAGPLLCRGQLGLLLGLVAVEVCLPDLQCGLHVSMDRCHAGPVFSVVAHEAPAHRLSGPTPAPLQNPPAVQETRVPSLGQEDPLEKEMATCSSTLSWRIPWMEE